MAAVERRDPPPRGPPRWRSPELLLLRLRLRGRRPRLPAPAPRGLRPGRAGRGGLRGDGRCTAQAASPSPLRGVPAASPGTMRSSCFCLDCASGSQLLQKRAQPARSCPGIAPPRGTSLPLLCSVSGRPALGAAPGAGRRALAAPPACRCCSSAQSRTAAESVEWLVAPVHDHERRRLGLPVQQAAKVHGAAPGQVRRRRCGAGAPRGAPAAGVGAASADSVALRRASNSATVVAPPAASPAPREAPPLPRPGDADAPADEEAVPGAAVAAASSGSSSSATEGTMTDALSESVDTSAVAAAAARTQRTPAPLLLPRRPQPR